ncbi:hypothetical protein H4R18_001860 [Coemansia javaensis]|uniref:SHSP domain-containing protein n=1 Tax=Coemansia javaensis TaxID=2761396 RepID=A0A9W8HG28_9FUNG|nr:hypothetical protein H4R18_001860 [Coemansia javaensis]
MESLFDGFFSSIEALREPGGAAAAAAAAAGGADATIGEISAGMWAPRVERRDSADMIHIEARLPGVGRDQVRVDASTPGRLRIYGECSAHAAYDCAGGRVRERRLGQLEKDIPLPPGARVAEMSVAAWESGGVTIRIPR